MHRLLYLFLTVTLLLSQLGLVAHAYQDHGGTEVCHLCLTSNQHDHALISTTVEYSVEHCNILHTSVSYQAVKHQLVRYYAVRAPPRFL